MFDKANKLAGKTLVFLSTGIGGFLLLLAFFEVGGGNLKNLTWPPGFAHVLPWWQNAHTWLQPGRGNAHAAFRKCAGCR